MFKFKRALFCLPLFIPLCVRGEEIKYGIGATSNHDVISLYAPITKGDLFVEPTLRFSETRSSNVYGEADYKSTTVGVGIFNRTKKGENTYVYGGGRVGVINVKSSYSDSWGAYYSKTHGYFIAPSVGAEYEFANGFSIGLELAYVFTKLKYEWNGAQISTSKSFDAKKDLIARYRF